MVVGLILSQKASWLWLTNHICKLHCCYAHYNRSLALGRYLQKKNQLLNMLQNQPFQKFFITAISHKSPLSYHFLCFLYTFLYSHKIIPLRKFGEHSWTERYEDLCKQVDDTVPTTSSSSEFCQWKKLHFIFSNLC